MQKSAKHCTVRADRHSAVGSGPFNCVTRGIIRRLAVATPSLLALVATSGFRVLDVPISGRDPHSATVLSRLPTGQPQGNGATVSLESRAWAPGLQEPTISTFTLTLAPGGSAILHRTPSPGYVLVHVLSGAIEAQAWHARLGTYRASATWAAPALANDITAVNASASEPARAFVLVVANGGD
jgi:quercetin dioxygenase-like cupin family protein